MRDWLGHRATHWVVLIVIGSALVFPFLGTASLWDDDEGVNAECTREMMETGTWIVPIFNWELRTAKPVFIYWPMRASYDLFGINEFAARFPSALFFLGSLLLTYELARRMFDPATGLLSAVIVATTLELGKLGRAATPDSTLIFFLLLYFWAFWRGHENGRRWWFIPCGFASGCAMLVKGPIGLVLPLLVIGSYFLIQWELRRLFDRRMLAGIAIWILVAIPWYALVTAETRGEWTRAFFFKENIGRSTEPMESHRGPVVYYLVVVCIFFAPWSSFVILTLREAWRAARSGSRPMRFLLILAGIVVGLFSVVATKLPHYIAPAYPALAILTASLLVRWMRREIEWPKWAFWAGIASTLLTGVAVVAGLLLAGGALGRESLPDSFRIFPGLQYWAWIGLFPIFGAAAFGIFARRGQRLRAVIAYATSAILFTGFVMAYPPIVIDQSKAVKKLVADSGARDLYRDAKLASLEYSQPSITFYAARRVERLNAPDAAVRFLAMTHPSYLFVAETLWNESKAKLKPPEYRTAARHYDFQRHDWILVIVNDR